MKKRKVFVDSDVVLSSLISSKGAAHLLLNEFDLDFVISNISLAEIERGVNKLDLPVANLKLLKTKLNAVNLNQQKINEELGVVVLTPAQYLQYLRSLK